MRAVNVNNNIIVDTSSWIQFFLGQSYPLIEDGLQSGRVYIPPIVAAELLSSVKKESEKQFLTSFLSDLPLCEAPFEHWLKVGALRRNLKSEGFTVSTPDAHIAQCCLDLKATLISEDKIFSKIAKHIHLKIKN